MKVPPIAATLALLFLLVGSGSSQEERTVSSRIKREPVQSSNVASIGYSRHLRALEIEFVRGAVYRFLEVPPGLHRALLAAPSKGRFMAENIRGRYRFIRIRSSRAKSPSPANRAGPKK